jgi:hypothetical protein
MGLLEPWLHAPTELSLTPNPSLPRASPCLQDFLDICDAIDASNGRLKVVLTLQGSLAWSGLIGIPYRPSHREGHARVSRQCLVPCRAMVTGDSNSPNQQAITNYANPTPVITGVQYPTLSNNTYHTPNTSLRAMPKKLKSTTQDIPTNMFVPTHRREHASYVQQPQCHLSHAQPEKAVPHVCLQEPTFRRASSLQPRFTTPCQDDMGPCEASWLSQRTSVQAALWGSSTCCSPETPSATAMWPSPASWQQAMAAVCRRVLPH